MHKCMKITPAQRFDDAIKKCKMLSGHFDSQNGGILQYVDRALRIYENTRLTSKIETEYLYCNNKMMI